MDNAYQAWFKGKSHDESALDLVFRAFEHGDDAWSDEHTDEDESDDGAVHGRGSFLSRGFLALLTKQESPVWCVATIPRWVHGANVWGRRLTTFGG